MTDAEICRWDRLTSDPDYKRFSQEIDQVFFFSSSARKSFDGESEKAAFRERWLGRYLLHFPQYAFAALDGERRVVGYIAGSLNDPACDPLFADLAFFQGFGALTARYPAQLHVNVGADWRGRGLGAKLVTVFVEAARAGGASGVHVVTTRGARNVDFYRANGFIERGAQPIDGHELLLLGRDL